MPLALMQEDVLPALRPLAHDHATGVRAALFSSAAQWAGSWLAAGAADAAGDDGRAANQCRTFLPLLLPLLLLGLTDEAEAIRSDTYSQLDTIGKGLASQVGGRRVLMLQSLQTEGAAGHRSADCPLAPGSHHGQPVCCKLFCLASQ